MFEKRKFQDLFETAQGKGSSVVVESKDEVPKELIEKYPDVQLLNYEEIQNQINSDKENRCGYEIDTPAGILASAFGSILNLILEQVTPPRDCKCECEGEELSTDDGEYNMSELANELVEVASNEYNRAARVYGPTVNSYHEGYALIREEYDEAVADMKLLDEQMATLWDLVTCKNVPAEVFRLESIKVATRALQCAAELVQVTAMCRKFTNLKEEE